MFSIQQLVDISLKALSPGINDPTTAEQVIDHLGGCLSRLTRRAIPSPLRELDGTKVLVRAPSFADYVDAAFAQIRREARGNLHVSLHLARALGRLYALADNPSRKAYLRLHLADLFAGMDLGQLSPADRVRLRAEISAADLG
jgi:uncharacterized membrane protein